MQKSQPRNHFLVSNNKCEKMNSVEICIPPPEFYKLSLKGKGRINPSRQVRTQVFIPTQPSWSTTLRGGTKTGRSQPRKRNWDPGNRRAGRASPRKAAAQQLSQPNSEPTDGGGPGEGAPRKMRVSWSSFRWLRGQKSKQKTYENMARCTMQAWKVNETVT